MGGRRRSLALIGLLGPASQTMRPAQGAGVRQRGGPFIPDACWKCHAPWIETGDWEARCLCGARWVRTVGEIRRPAGAPRVGHYAVEED